MRSAPLRRGAFRPSGLPEIAQSANLTETYAPYLTMIRRHQFTAQGDHRVGSEVVPRGVKIGAVALLAATLLMSTACSSGQQQSTSGSPRAVVQLRSIQELRNRFNQDRGMVRLILLVSPT